MAGVNKAILVGNLTRDPEIRTTQNSKVASFTIATNEFYKDKEGNRKEAVEYHNIEFWGPIVQVIEKYIKKGSKVYVEGKLKTDSYEKDGVKRYVTKIVGKQLTMLDSKSSDNKPAPDEPVGEEDKLPF